MGATLELNIVSKKKVDVRKLIDLLETTFENKFEFVEIEVANRGDYDNSIYVPEIDYVYTNIDEGKVANLYLVADGEHRIGFRMQKIDDVYFMCIWVDTEKLRNLDYDYITYENKMVYKQLVKITRELTNDFGVIVAGIGNETRFRYHKNVEMLIEKSERMSLWYIVNKKIEKIRGFDLIKNEDNVSILGKVID